MIPAELPLGAVSNYRAHLYPWCIVQLLPSLQRATVARFRRRSEAEECQKVLQRLQPDSQYRIVFDLAD